MTVRAVEGKKPYTGGKGIEIDENKVISLRLRDENNLIIWDEGDNEIYVDLQLDDEIRPTDAFPVGITTGRVIIDNGWDKTGTLICAKTTSGDNIKIFYSDDGHLYVDHGTGLFTQVYLKPEVDALLLDLRQYVDQQLALKQDKLIAGERITINADGKTINADLQVSDIAYGPSWDGVTGIAPSKNAVYDKINSIDTLIPSAATSSNKLADKNYVDDSINQVAAYYITKNAQGDAFANYAELSSATVFYSGGVQRTPTRNDFCIVIADETHSGDATRYSYQGNQWEYQYTINNAPMTQAQVDAINSGITAGKVSTYDGYANDIAGKQDALTAGSNIQIDPNTNVISATDTTYSAGNGINIDANNEISVDTTVVATQTDLSNGLSNKQDTLTAGQNIAIDQNNEISVDYSWTTITISSGNATLTDTRCKLIPTGNFTLKAPSTVSEGQEYVLRCENTTVYTMTLGAGFTNPHNVDLTLSANATDQFIFLATPSGDLELQPAQLGAGTGISISNGIINNTLPGAIVSSTAPSNPSQGDLWYDTTTDQLNSYDGSSWNPVDVDTTYTAGSGIDIDANNEITVKLAQNSGLGINASDELEVDTSVIQTKMYSAGSSSPSNPSQGDQWYDTTNDELKIYDGSAWNAVGGGGDVGVSSQANNIFTPGMKIWGGTSANYANLTPDGNTAYLII